MQRMIQAQAAGCSQELLSLSTYQKINPLSDPLSRGGIFCILEKKYKRLFRMQNRLGLGGK